MRRAWTDRLAVATLLAALSGCGDHAREIIVGVHHLRVKVPAGWESADHGLEHTLRNGSARIAIKDMGVATRSGLLEEVVKQTLGALGQSERRRIATQIRIAVGGRSALQVDTWDWLSHGHRKRFVLLFNRGHLLVIWTRSGHFEDTQGAYGQLLNSLRLGDRPAEPEHGSTVQ